MSVRRSVPGSKSRVAFLLFLVSSFVWPAIGRQNAPPDFVDRLRFRIEASPGRDEEWILSARALPAFYEERAYQPAWVGGEGLLPRADAMVRAIEQVAGEGLEPGDYHLGRIRELIRRVRDAGGTPDSRTGLLVELELRLTDAFLMLASHLVAGRTDPESLRAEWVAVRRDADPVARLRQVINTGDVEGVLSGLAPQYLDYDRLRRARAGYAQIAESGGWPTVPDGGKLERGTSNSRLVALRRRLVATGDLSARTPLSDDFDGGLEAAVIAFQRRHGLDADGVVGPATLAALNVSASDRVRQIDVNLERWRWLPQDLGARYILVNIANFEMDLVEDGQVTMNMRAVVGRPYRRTPVFSDRLTYLVLNPRWSVPTGIATADILPKLRSDPNYLANQNMKVFQGWGADQRELRQSDVDWSRVTARGFNYHFRQEPGPTNALGRVKFMFPNSFNVYLHDTPSRELFNRTDRTFSSGCIRLERPLDLAAYLLGKDRNWTRGQLDAALALGTEQSVTLLEPLPVHLLYWTAWVEPDGRIQFRNDVYNRDTPVREALDEAPPRS